MEANNFFIEHAQGLNIRDQDGALTSLPEDFFDKYRHIKSLSIRETGLTELPASINKLQDLRSIEFYKTKIKALPDSFTELRQLTVFEAQSNSLDLNKEADKLAQLPALEVLYLGGYRGTSFPPRLALLKQLKKLRVGSELKNKLTFKEVLNVIPELTSLQELEWSLPINPEDVDESFLVLDRLVKLTGWRRDIFGVIEECPLILSRTQNVLLNRPVDAKLITFRVSTRELDLNNDQKDLLFGIDIKNYIVLNRILPNVLKDAVRDKKELNLILLDKPKGESAKSIREKLSPYGITVVDKKDHNSVVVIGDKTTLEDAIPYVVANNTFITVDHLKEILIAGADPWLLQKENETSNDQLLQLFASNQTDNLKIAFQIIEGGGANPVIQALLAAVMTSHPEPPVAKAAEKLYDKYGSQSYKQYVKNSKISVRKSGHTIYKVNGLVDHPDIDGFTFRLMHHTIASANKNIADVQPGILHIKDASNIRFSPSLPFFSNIKELHFENCSNLDIAGGIGFLKQMSQCKVLSLDTCRISIPASIGELTQLTYLDLKSNTLESADSLQTLTSLKSLNLEATKITDWNWLPSLTQLEQLSIGHCALTEVPEGVYTLRNLVGLHAKQNKIKSIDPKIAGLSRLSSLDFSNNQLTEFPYIVGRLNNLRVLLLRSNALGQLDTQRLKKEMSSSKLPWSELNLSRTGLKQFSFGDLSISSLRILDLSHNEIPTLDDSLFRDRSLTELYADNNKISAIPPSISNNSHFSKLWLHKNAIRRLEDYMAKVRVENCDLSHNQIEFIHPDFDVYGKENYGRLYWKVRNNPIWKTLNHFGGIHG